MGAGGWQQCMKAMRADDCIWSHLIYALMYTLYDDSYVRLPLLSFGLDFGRARSLSRCPTLSLERRDHIL